MEIFERDDHIELTIDIKTVPTAEVVTKDVAASEATTEPAPVEAVTEPSAAPAEQAPAPLAEQPAPVVEQPSAPVDPAAQLPAPTDPPAPAV